MEGQAQRGGKQAASKRSSLAMGHFDIFIDQCHYCHVWLTVTCLVKLPLLTVSQWHPSVLHAVINAEGACDMNLAADSGSDPTGADDSAPPLGEQWH